MHRWFCVGLLLVAFGNGAWAEPGTPERVVWRKSPIALELEVGTERRVDFPAPVQVGLPRPLQNVLRVQSVQQSVYLRAEQAFPATRLVVRSPTGLYLLDVSAVAESTPVGPVTILDPGLDEAPAGKDADASPGYSYVALTRFAAQHVYAPARLLEVLPGVVRVPVKRDSVPLVRGGAVKAVPWVAWRTGDLHVTAVKLTNQAAEPQVLDPRSLRGRWLTATFQHHRLLPAGDEADGTVVYLISERPFAASM